MHAKVAGEMMSAVAPWGDLSYSTDEHGCKQADIGFYLPRGERHPALERGATFEIKDASARVWYGLTGEPNWREGTLTAYGLAREAEGYQCLDALGNATARPDVAADRAADRGWQILGRSGVPTTAYTDAAEGINTLAALFDSYSDELGQRWSVRADRILRFESDPTTPVLRIRPGVVDLGTNDQDYASTAAVRYKTTTGAYATALRTDTAAQARFGHREVPVDATGLGPISTARANAIGDGILTKGRARLGWTSQIEVDQTTLFTIGGESADLTLVESGQMVRIDGIHDDLAFLGGRTYFDAVIGEFNHAPRSGVATLAPLGSTAQSLADVIEEVMRTAAQAA